MGNLVRVPPSCSEKDLDVFIESEIDRKKVAGFMWTLQYYYSFLENDTLLKYVSRVREKHTAKKRRPFDIKDFVGVNPSSAEALANHGIRTVDDMLEAAKTKKQRSELAKKTGVSEAEIFELAKLSNLAQVGGVKSVRARLYHDAGVDSVEKLAGMTAEELQAATSRYIEKTGFDGIPPTPKEAANAVKDAKKLKDKIEL